MSTEHSESIDMKCSSTAAPQEEQPTQELPNNENPPTSRQNPASHPSLPLQQDYCAEIVMNKALYDPPRWGWTALGGLADVLTPHERSRRFSTCRAYKSKKRTRRQRKCAIGGGAVTKMESTETTLQLKDPPSQSALSASDKESSLGNHLVTEQRSPSEPISSSALTPSQSISENPSQQAPQHSDAKEPNSRPESTIDTGKSIIPNQTISGEASIVEGNDSNCSEQPKSQQRQDATDDTDRKTNNPLENENKTPQPNAEAKEILDQSNLQSEKAVAMSKEKPKSDLGLETIGISTSVLGMTIRKQGSQQSTTQGNNDGNDQEDESHKKDGNSHTPSRRAKKFGKTKSRRTVGGVVPRTKYDCEVQSLGISSNLARGDVDGKIVDTENNTTMILDMYAYHQGREGMEARDAETGELLCTQHVTDTNHDFDAPKSTFPIEIEFPLEDEDEMDENDFPDSSTASSKMADSGDQILERGKDKNAMKPTKANSSKKTVAMYKEILTWDLFDPNTPTPQAFASSIGNEYGLSFGQIMNLAARIDKQIQKHVTEISHYREPIATREPIQDLTQPRKLGPIRQPYRFDEVLQAGKEGGTFKPKRHGRAMARPRPSVGISKKDKSGRSILASVEPANTSMTPKVSTSDKRDKGKKIPVINKSDLNLEDELSDKLLDLVRRRSKTQQVREIGKLGVLKHERNAICHICKKRVPMGYGFACSVNNHVYCDLHVRKRLKLTKEYGVYKADFCPICTLACECAKCIRKLKDVATLLKAKSIVESKPPREVDFPNILSACTKRIPPKDLSEATDVVLEKKMKEILSKRRMLDQDPDKSPDKKSRTCLLAGQTMVPKPPLSDFPTELHGGVDFDTGATAAYFTAYSSDGRRSVNDVPDAWLDDERAKTGPELSQLSVMKSTPEVQEDGNVDYCHICKTAGHLILCDHCPRGFHQDCLKNNRLSPDGDNWECFVCKDEKTPSDKHFVDGKESIEVISRSFSDLDAMDDGALVGLEVLSIIHQMLTKLIDYDFGFIFSKPVDVSLVPGYADVVKRPMDIGTILSKLENKEFAALLTESFSMDDLLIKILNDIELIWRNCIMFNVIGSSVARMALVLRRRVKMICKQSIFPKLRDEVKTKVLNYARKFDEAWASGITASLSNENDDSMSDDWKLSAIANLKPKSAQEFSGKPSTAKPIAVLDTVSGRVVKLYSSHKSASRAVDIIVKSGHRCEWNAVYGLNLKLVAEKSKVDPNTLLFGYRWLFLDDLNRGNVAFSKTVDDMIEVRHTEFTSIFRSIEEALSSFQLSKTVNIDLLRKKLIDLPRDGKWVEMDGLHWRRPVVPHQRSTHLKSEDPMTLDEEDNGTGPNLVSDSESLLSWKSCGFLKKDLVTDQFLVGFDSIQLAYQDWMQNALSSPSFPSSEAQTMDNFKKYYLDGDRNIDGMIWQTGDNRENKSSQNEVEEKSESTVQEERSSLSQSGESTNQSLTNNTSSPSFSTIAMSSHQRIVSEDPSAAKKSEESPDVLGKRKHLGDNNDESEFPPNKEARLCSIVT